MSDGLLVADTGAVRILTMDRPERLNALDNQMLVALHQALEAAADDRTVRAVLLTGSGRGFCAGADLLQILEGDARPDLGVLVDTYYNPLVRRMRSLPKPIVVAVNGVAAGAGMSLALGGDVLVAARSATFAQAFIRIGLMPDAGGTYFMPRLVGEGRARALAMLGETLDAAQAQALGIVWKVYDDEALAAAALQLATEMAARPTQAIAAMKHAFAASATNTLNAQLDLERDLQGSLGKTADFAEGVRAFREKRPPVFGGKV